MAFEPSALTYAILVQNVELNNFEDILKTFNVALNDETKVDKLYCPTMISGDAPGHVFAESPSNAVENVLHNAPNVFGQNTIGFALDDIVEQFGLEPPNHIKIDVDGIENRIIRGAKKTISNRRVKSLSIEVYQSWRDGEYRDGIFRDLKEVGFHFIEERRNCVFRRLS